jgi:hypothetical protein
MLFLVRFCLQYIVKPPTSFIGHRNSYEKGVLHHDISLGNIIITGKFERGHRGVLIDYDNAIFWKNHQAVTDDPLSVCPLVVCFVGYLFIILLGYSTIHVIGDIRQRIYF